jgi:hypothetical protein
MTEGQKMEDQSKQRGRESFLEALYDSLPALLAEQKRVGSLFLTVMLVS